MSFKVGAFTFGWNKDPIGKIYAITFLGCNPIRSLNISQINLRFKILIYEKVTDRSLQNLGIW